MTSTEPTSAKPVSSQQTAKNTAKPSQNPSAHNNSAHNSKATKPTLEQQFKALAAKTEQALLALSQLWQQRHQPIDGDIKEILNRQQQQQQVLSQLQQQMQQDIAYKHPERAFLEYASATQARLWLNQEGNQLILKALDHDSISETELKAIFANEALFRTLNQLPADQALAPSQVLSLLTQPGPRKLAGTTPEVLLNKAWLTALKQSEFIALLNQPEVIKLLDQQDFRDLFKNSDFVKLFEDNVFVKLFEDSDSVKLFENHQFIESLQNANTLTKVQQTIESSPALIKHWPKLAGSAAPKLAYWVEQSTGATSKMRIVLESKFSLITDTDNHSTLKQSLIQGQVNTLVLPLASMTAIPNFNVLRDFVALGGRIISNLHPNNLALINSFFGWKLQYANLYKWGTLIGSQLHVSAPSITKVTYTTERSSLPSNAQVFLHRSERPDEVTGVYTPYGLGEVILIGYNLFQYNNSGVLGDNSYFEWNTLLHGLIDGTALPYQRRYKG